MASRADRVKALQKTAKEYIAAEKKRVENEVSVLEDILDKRTGGKGIQRVSIKIVQDAADSALTAYLRGE